MTLAAATSPWPGILALVVVLLLGALATWGGFRALGRKRLLEIVPTSKVKGVFGGLNEVKGAVRCDVPLVSFLAEAACVHYRYSIEERWQRTETVRDKKGRTTTRTRSGWTTVDSGGEMVPFDLEDETGRLLVRPEGAEIDADVVLSETCGRGDPLYYGKGPPGAVSSSTHRRRFSETAIPVGSAVYVLGPARMREDVAAPEIARDPAAEIFLISRRSERQLTRRYGWSAFGCLLAGTAAAFAFPVALALLDAGEMRRAVDAGLPFALGAVGVYLGVIAAFYLVSVHNGLVAVRERAEMAWSLVDVQLERRHDLVPRLVACVEAAAAHEAGVQEALAALRTEGDSEAGGASPRALRSVLALAERLPRIRADGSFALLHRHLVDCEERIALAREYYNDAVEALNSRVQSFPDSLVARLVRLRPRALFAADGLERAVPPAG